MVGGTLGGSGGVLCACVCKTVCGEGFHNVSNDMLAGGRGGAEGCVLCGYLSSWQEVCGDWLRGCCMPLSVCVVICQPGRRCVEIG